MRDSISHLVRTDTNTLAARVTAGADGQRVSVFAEDSSTKTYLIATDTKLVLFDALAGKDLWVK